MQLTRPVSSSFDTKKVEQILIAENKYISNLFSILSLPNRNDNSSDVDENEDEEDEDQHHQHKYPANPKTTNTTRAKSLQELQSRLEAITSKKRLTYKDKVTRKGLKNRMKKKYKQDERNAERKLVRAQQSTIKPDPGSAGDSTAASSNGPVIKTARPVFNSEGRMVFSKFDFSNMGQNKGARKPKDKDPKRLLDHLKKHKEKLVQLTESGDQDRVMEIKEKTAWRNALSKAQGEKVRDDPMLLKKSVKRQEQQKKSSKKKWEARQENVTKAKDERQQKRTDNINKRKKDKKNNKLKKAAKKGRIVPGF